MKYTKRSQIWVLTGVPLCVLGMGVLLYLVDMGNGRSGNEASFVAAKSLIGVGRGFYQTAAQVSVQAMVSRQDVSVVTAVFFASMSVGGAIGTRYVQSFPEQVFFSYFCSDSLFCAASLVRYGEILCQINYISIFPVS